MRVLHCIWRMGLGGAERQLAQLSSGLMARNVEVHVVTVFAGVYDPLLAATGAITHRLHPLGKYDATLIPRMVPLLRRIKPDVATTWLTQMDIVGGLAASIAGLPWVLCERCSAEAYAPSFIHPARARVAGRAAAIVANAGVGRDYWRGLTRRPIHVVPNIVPLAEIESAPAEVGDADADAGIILFAGRLAAQKNIELLLDALAMVLAERPAPAIFCGDGLQRAAFESKASSLGIAHRTRFLGSMPNVWSWMKVASVVVSPSLFEGDPNVVLEAIAARAPLVVSDIAPHRALLNDRSAWLVDPRSPDSIAAGLHAALDDRSEAQARAERAYAVVAKRTAYDIAGRYIEVFEDAIRGKR